jgi:uncharacterized membrane protein YozB (DUF420 family)
MFGEGFLGRGGTLGGDLNLLVQAGLGLMIIAGAVLARRGWYRAHGACQASALAIAAVMTVAWMVPSFREVYAPDLSGGVIGRTTAGVLAHAALGTVVLLLGIYVVLVAGTDFIPQRFRFRNYTAWMRTLLVLWLIATGLGALTYLFL